MKIEVTPPPPPPEREIVLRLTPSEAATVRRALFIADAVRNGATNSDLDEYRESYFVWAPLDGALALFNAMVQADVGN